MTTGNTTFAGGFDASTRDDWLALAQAGLKGRSVESLVSQTYSGIDLQPVYDRLTSPSPQPQPSRNGPWQVVQRIDIPDAGAANAQMHEDLAGGATCIELVFDASAQAGKAGIAIEDISEMARLLDGLELEAVPLRLCAGHECRHVTALLIGHLLERGFDPSKLDLRLNFDAVSDLAQHGFMNFSFERAYARATDLDESLRRLGIDAQFPTLDGRPWHAAGASEPQELAAIVASAIEHIRGLAAAGSDLATMCGKTSFTVAADTDQFMTVAKIRALRRIWAVALQAMGVDPAPVHIHAETAWRVMSKRDPHVNVLRGTMAAFAAGTGGADSISVLPYTAACGLPDAFARRLARNTQNILVEEANVHRVNDPVAGAGAFEALTDSLARAAWSLFQAIEADGGLVKSLRAGRPQAMVAETRKSRMENVCRLKDPLVGVSAFPNLKELPVEVLKATPAEVQSSNLRIKLPEPGMGNLFSALIDAARSGVSLADMSLSRKPQPQTVPASIPAMRLSEPFEALRDASDDALEHSGARPHALIAGGAGSAADARHVAWLRRVLPAGGIAVYGETHEGSDAEIAAKLKETGARIACLCPDNAASKTSVSSSVQALVEAGAAAVILVEASDTRSLAGGERKLLFAHPGCDVVALMSQALELAGIKPAVQLGFIETGARA